MTSLSLAQNDLGDDGAEALSIGLKENKSIKMLDLSGKGYGDGLIGPRGATALASAIAVIASLTECNVRGNALDGDSATLLAKVAREKRVMIFGIKHNQTEAIFQGLGPVDAILIASDLSVSPSVTEVR